MLAGLHPRLGLGSHSDRAERWKNALAVPEAEDLGQAGPQVFVNLLNLQPSPEEGGLGIAIEGGVAGHLGQGQLVHVHNFVVCAHTQTPQKASE